VQATGAATSAGVEESTGTGAAVGVGASIAASVGQAGGAGVAASAAQSIRAAVAAANGEGLAVMASAIVAVSAGTSSGAGVAAGVGVEIIEIIGSAAGAGALAAAGVGIRPGVGAAAGAGAASAAGASRAEALGSAIGAGSASAAALASKITSGSAIGTGIVIGVGRFQTDAGNETPAERVVRVNGKGMVLRRTGENTTVLLSGKRIPGSVEATGNSAGQQIFRVKVSVAEIRASAWLDKAPKRDDSIRIDNRDHTLLDARPLKHRGVLQLYELTVAG